MCSSAVVKHPELQLIFNLEFAEHMDTSLKHAPICKVTRHFVHYLCTYKL